MFYILLTIWYGCLLLCVRYWTSLLIFLYSNYTLETASHFFVGFLVRYFSLPGFFDFHEFFFILFFSTSIDWSIWNFNFKKILHSKTYYRSFCADFNYFFCCFSRYLWLFLEMIIELSEWALEWDVKLFEWFAVGTKLKGVKNFIEDVYQNSSGMKEIFLYNLYMY